MRFLFIIPDSWGPLGCTIPVAHELQSRGHEIYYHIFDFHDFINKHNPLTVDVDAAEILRDEGFEALSCPLTPITTSGELPTPRNFLLEFPAFQRLFRRFLIPYYEQRCRDMMPMIRDLEPDAIWLKDQVLSGAMAATVLGIRWATFSVHTGLLEDADSLPWMMGFSAPKNLLERTRNRVLKLGMRLGRMTLDPPFNASRRRVGLPPLRDALRTTAISPYLYTLFVPKELEPPRRHWPESVRFVGPYCWDEPKGYERPDWLDEIPSDRPLIYACIGSSQPKMDIDFFPLVMEALGDEPYTVVVSTGTYRSDDITSRLPSAPDNFRIGAYLPNSVIVPKADVLIHHAGAGTIMHGFANGVPAVAIPLNLEHPDFAQRLVEKGCGIRIDKKDLTAGRLRDAVRRLVEDPSFKRAAARFKEQIDRYDSPTACADALTELAEGGARQRATG